MSAYDDSLEFTLHITDPRGERGQVQLSRDVIKTLETCRYVREVKPIKTEGVSNDDAKGGIIEWTQLAVSALKDTLPQLLGYLGKKAEQSDAKITLELKSDDRFTIESSGDQIEALMDKMTEYSERTNSGQSATSDET